MARSLAIFGSATTRNPVVRLLVNVMPANVAMIIAAAVMERSWSEECTASSESVTAASSVEAVPLSTPVASVRAVGFSLAIDPRGISVEAARSVVTAGSALWWEDAAVAVAVTAIVDGCRFDGLFNKLQISVHFRLSCPVPVILCCGFFSVPYCVLPPTPCPRGERGGGGLKSDG